MLHFKKTCFLSTVSTCVNNILTLCEEKSVVPLQLMCCLTGVLLFTLVTCAYKQKPRIISLLLYRMIIALIHRIYTRPTSVTIKRNRKRCQ